MISFFVITLAVFACVFWFNAVYSRLMRLNKKIGESQTQLDAALAARRSGGARVAEDKYQTALLSHNNNINEYNKLMGAFPGSLISRKMKLQKKEPKTGDGSMS